MPPKHPQHVTFVAHTHWDREWYRPFESFRADLLHVLDDALDRLESDPRLSFTLDGQMALVEDYLEMRPDAEPRIRALVGEGRLHVGPWFTASDTLLVDGEAIIRNLVMGLRSAARFGVPLRVGYMPDQFGHAAQIPQILRSVGIEAAVLWRGVGPERPPHAFTWVAPDGSAVKTAWLQDGYATGRRLPSDPEGFADAMERMFARLSDWIGDEPMLVPIGDDHVAVSAWLPAAAAALQQRHPALAMTVGGLAHHVERMGAPAHRVHGELRSPAHAPVLAGVASARVREKQAAARVAALLVDEVEPLWAWLASRGHKAPTHSIERAWRHLLHNHAHDSIAGCGADDAHDDVKARYRWAEQLARSAKDRALSLVAVDGDEAALATRAVFHPGPRATHVVVETELPRALLDGKTLISRGADGRKWPVQVLGQAHEPPVFEGEFPSSEIAMYLGGLDPMTPLFGKYLTGIALCDDGPGRVRFDVALGDAPASAAHLAAEQKRVEEALGRSERIRVVLHAGNVTRKVLIAGGPVPSCGFASIAVEHGEPDAAPAIPTCGSDGARAIFTEGLVVVAESDGSVRIVDARAAIAMRANDLVSDGDRGDLYHFDAVGQPVRAKAARVSVVESGPLRGRLRIEQDLDVPVGLTADRKARSTTTRTITATTEVTIVAGERRVDFVTTVDNEVRDHRLRALVHVPLAAERFDVENGLAVVARPRDTASLGAGNERPAATGQHQLFVDVGDGARGVALMAHGLREHELVGSGADTQLALTLVRSVGWLARGDLSSIDHAAGPMMATPGAQELGAHKFEYALLLHDGDWQAADVYAEARRHQSPPTIVPGRGTTRVPAGHGLVETGDAHVRVVAAYPTEKATILRLLNASSQARVATLRPAWHATSATVVDPLEQPIPGAEAHVDEAGQVRVELRAWQIATLRLGW